MSRISAKELYEMPLYSPAEAAHYLRLPVSTARAWSFGQAYRDAKGESHRFEPVIAAADRKNRRLSFINLVELLVLTAMRRTHSVQLRDVRNSIQFLRMKFPSAHPLADHSFQTNGVDLFVEKFGQLVNISRDGQIEMEQMIKAYLRGVERDSKGIPVKLYLPSRDPNAQQPSRVVIDPSRGFGRPVVDSVGVRTDVVLQRFRAGEGITSLAADYALEPNVIEDVIRLAA